MGYAGGCDYRAFGGEAIMNDGWKFSIEQDGIVVASGEAANEEDAKREAAHYAMMYSQDGTVKVSLKQRKG